MEEKARPNPNPLPQEREIAGTVLENSNVAVAVPASLCSVSEAHDHQARSYYQSTAECFSLSLRERAGVRGNSATAVLVASALKSAPETARGGCTALIHSSFQASGLPEVVDLERQFSVGSLKVKFLDRNENDVTGLKLGIFGRIGGVK